MTLPRIAASLALLAVLFAAGCATPQQKEAKYLGSGKKFLADKDYSRAVLQFRNAVKIAPRDTEPRYQLALAYLETNNFSGAVGELKKITELDPKHIGAQLKLAELMSAASDRGVLEQSQRLVHSVLATSPDNADALNTLAVTEQRLGKTEDAIHHLEQVLGHSPANLRAALTLSVILLKKGDMPGAEKILKTAAAQTPPSADAFVALGEFYQLSKNPREAAKNFSRAIELNPKNGVAMVDMARAQYEVGDKTQAGETLKKLSALPDPQFKTMHALFLFETGNATEGLAELKKLSETNPGDRTIRSRLVAAYAEMNKLPDAQLLLAAALKRNPKDTDALLQRGEIYWKSGKFTDAEKDLLDVLRYQPDLAAAHYLLAKIQQGQGKVYNQRQELSEALRLRPDMLQVRIELAQLLLNQKDPQSALKLMDQAPEPQKNLLPAVIERNWALLAKGEKGEARKNLDAGLALGKSPEMLLQKAVLDLEESRWADARAALNEILKQRPDDLRAMEILVRSYAMQNQTAAGIEKLREFAAARPKSAEVQTMLGNWLLTAGNVKAARAAYVAAKAANPNYSPADLAIAQVDVENGQLDSARQILTALLVREPKNLEALLSLGTAEQLAGDRKAAVEHYRAVLAADSRNVAALNNLAFLMTDTPDQMDEGLKYAQQAVQLAPESPSVLDTTGWAYYQKGIYRTGVKYLESAVSKEGTAVRRYHLAMAYMKSGEPQRGREALQIALKMNPNLPEARTAQAMLDKVSR